METKKYKYKFHYTGFVKIEVEANNENEALIKAVEEVDKIGFDEPMENENGNTLRTYSGKQLLLFHSWEFEGY